MILVVVCLVASICGFSGEQAGAESKSHTGRDHVRITKITPRTSADIPVPCSMPFSLELSYNLATADSGRIRLGVFLWRPGVNKTKGTQASSSALKGLQPLIKPIEKKIKKGSGAITITTPAVSLPKVSGNNYQVVVVANVQDSTKKELCWATSYNFLRGTLSVRTTADKGTRDYVRVVSAEPRQGALVTGREHTFNVVLRYNLKSKPYGYVNLELGQSDRPGNIGPWYSVCVPVKQGMGMLYIATRKFFLPAAYAGRQLEMLVPFRVNPLGGTVCVLQVGPWPLQRPSVGR